MSRLFPIFFVLACCLQPLWPGLAASPSGAPEDRAVTEPSAPAAPPLRAAWLDSGTWLPGNYSPEQRALHQESVQAFVSHFNYLNSIPAESGQAGRPPFPVLLLEPPEATSPASPAEVLDPASPAEPAEQAGRAALADRAGRLAARSDLDLILVTGPEALAALGRAFSERASQPLQPGQPGQPDPAGPFASPVPVLVLSPDCPLPQLRELDGAAVWPAGDGSDGVLLPPAAFWRQRLEDYAGAVRFRRLGLILPAEPAPLAERAVALAWRQRADELAASGRFAVFTYEDLADTSPEQCREAVDYLFFDEIDALLLDGYGCFSPERPDYAELLELLRQRGIFPLSLREAGLSEGGALLAPAPGQGERLGRAAAAGFFAAALLELQDKHQNGRLAGAPAGNPGLLNNIPRRLGGHFAAGLPLFAVNLATAGSMGFDPPAALLAVSRALSATP